MIPSYLLLLLPGDEVLGAIAGVVPDTYVPPGACILYRIGAGAVDLQGTGPGAVKLARTGPGTVLLEEV